MHGAAQSLGRRQGSWLGVFAPSASMERMPLRNGDKAECQLCGAETTDPLICVGCSAVFYCSKKHQQRHWKLAHDKECSRFQQQLTRGKACLPPTCLISMCACFTALKRLCLQELEAFPFTFLPQHTPQVVALQLMGPQHTVPRSHSCGS